MKNKLLALISTVIVFSASPVLAMDQEDQGIICFPCSKPILKLREDKDLGSRDPQLVDKLQSLASEYVKNPRGVSVSQFDSSLKCLPRCMWEIEKELYKGDKDALKCLSNADSSGTLEGPEFFSYISVAFRDSNGDNISIGRLPVGISS